MPKGIQRPTAEQREFAKQLRHELTDCERLLWQNLRNRQLGGFKFRRQYPLPPYVLDFYCAELGLAVELDGGQHFSDQALRRDAERSRYLGGRGIRVIRFSNREVLAQMPELLAEILRQAEMAALTPALGFSVLRRPTSCIHAVVSPEGRGGRPCEADNCSLSVGS